MNERGLGQRGHRDLTARRTLSRFGPFVLLLAVVGILAGLVALQSDAREKKEQALADTSPGSPSAAAPPNVVRGEVADTLRFEPNWGQINADAPFLARGRGNLLLSPTEVVLPQELGQESTSGQLVGVPVSMRLLGARPDAEMEGLDRLPSTSNYFLGKDASQWRTSVPNFARLIARDVYPGIDTLYRSAADGFEYDWLVAPDADPGRIAVTYPGTTAVSLDSSGDLLLETPAGTVRQHRPVAFQQLGNTQEPVAVRYLVEGSEVRLEVGEWDRRRPLVIDPVLSYATYLGGPGTDYGYGLSVDVAGNAYVVGGSAAGFPTAPDTVHSPEPPGGGGSLSVTKLAPDGSLIYATYLTGGSSPTILADDAGNAYVVGTGGPDFPTLPDSRYRDCAGSTKTQLPFVVKLDPTGSNLLYSTCLADTPGAFRATLGQAGTLFVAGSLLGDALPTFPRKNAVQETFAGESDLWMMQLDTAASGEDSLLLSTLLGSTGGESIGSLASHGDEVVLAGSVTSPTEVLGPVESFPIGDNNYSDGCPPPAVDGDKFGLLFSLRVPGAGPPSVSYSACFEAGGVNDVDIDPLSGTAFVVGGGGATATANAFRASPAGDADEYVAAFNLNATGTASLLYLSHLGVGSSDAFPRVAVAPDGRAWVAGGTESMDAPVRQAIAPSGPRGDEDVYLMELDIRLQGDASLLSSSVLGGSRQDQPFGVDVGPTGDVWVMGATRSADFPVLPGGLQSGPAGDVDSLDLFVLRVSPSPRLDRIEPAVGSTCAPTPVSLRGANLAKVTSVMFGDAPAQFQVVNDEEIAVQSPPGNQGSVPVVVRIGEGESNAVAFEYVASVPVVENVDPLEGPTTGGTAVTLTGNGLGCVQEVRFGSVPATDLRLASADELGVVAPGQAGGTVPLFVDGALVPFDFTYTPPLPIVAAVAPACGPVTGGTPVIISGTGLEGATEVRFGGFAVAARPDPDSGGTRVSAVTPSGLEDGVSVSIVTLTGASTPVTDAFSAPCPSGEVETDPNVEGGLGGGTPPGDNASAVVPPGGTGGSPGGAFSTNPGATAAPGDPFVAPVPGPLVGASPTPVGSGMPTGASAPGAVVPTGAVPAPSAAPIPAAVAPTPGAVPSWGPSAPGALPGISGAGRGVDSAAGSQGFAMVAHRPDLIPGGMTPAVGLSAGVLGLFTCLLVRLGEPQGGRAKQRACRRPAPVVR